MILPDRRGLKNAARESLNNTAGTAGKLVAIHTAAMLLLSLIVMIADLLLEQQIENTSGLSGMGLRSVLTTAQVVLQYAQLIVMPFWQIGWLFTAMKIARGERTGVADLTEGFCKFLPVLRLTILKGLIMIAAVFVATYAGSFAVMLSPLSGPTISLMLSDVSEMEMLAQMEKMLTVVMIVGGILSLIVVIPFAYRLRMAEYALLDDPKPGARAALRTSWQMMKGNMWKMMGLDLQFWWFYLLEGAISVLGMADILLPLAGITLPWSETVSYFATFLLAAVAQVLLHYFLKPGVDVTYAHAYLSLIPPAEEEAEQM